MEQKIIYLMRHGSADERGLLTEGGKEQVKMYGESIKCELNEDSKIKIYHSPLPRAKESANILASTIGKQHSEILEREALDCHQNRIEEVVNEIIRLGIIISHNPDIMSYLYKTEGEKWSGRNFPNGSYTKLLR